MKETEMQKLLADTVNQHGGFAYKLSNRFLIGVPDLLVKLPGAPAGVMEAKQHVLAANTPVETFALAVTVLQRRFLKTAQAAGMPCGVASFIQTRNKGIRGLLFKIYTFDEAEERAYIARVDHHRPLGTDKTRAAEIMTEFKHWMERTKVW